MSLNFKLQRGSGDLEVNTSASTAIRKSRSSSGLLVGMVDKMEIPFAYLDIEIHSLTSTEVRIRNTVLKVDLQDNYSYDNERVHSERSCE